MAITPHRSSKPSRLILIAAMVAAPARRSRREPAYPRRTFTDELNSGFENGRIRGPRLVIDEDKLDLHQAFVDVTVGVAASAAVLRVGR